MAGTALAQLDDSLTGARVALEEVPVVDFRPFLSGRRPNASASRSRSAAPAGTSASSTS